MQLISCHDGKLLKVDSAALGAAAERAFVTGEDAIDQLLPAGGFARGAVHEMLARPGQPSPLFFTAWVARAGAAKADDDPAVNAPANPKTSSNAIVWSDPRGELYPPGLAAAGIEIEQLYLLRPTTADDEIWAVAECLACKGVAVTVAAIPKMSRVQARRLQLAAERGGGVGLILRTYAGDGVQQEHAAATRWLVEPARGERTTQRWTARLVHGHGGRLHHPVYLEYSRETHRVRATDRLADRQAPSETRVVG